MSRYVDVRHYTCPQSYWEMSIIFYAMHLVFARSLSIMKALRAEPTQLAPRIQIPLKLISFF